WRGSGRSAWSPTWCWCRPSRSRSPWSPSTSSATDSATHSTRGRSGDCPYHGPVSDPVLRVKDLRTSFFTDDGEVKAVRGVSFDLEPGETLGIVGESGCGTSVTALSILGLVQPPVRVISGEVLFKGDDLLKVDADELRRIRGNDIAMIFQDPLSSFNPVLQVGFQ